mmetsp:Transcript_124631/g.216054  ORF Transcript_124631/g.216054 Transcript_124631/m.216054 type:complete len:145 (+) Transcript_124631:362-796(+)
MFLPAQLPPISIVCLRSIACCVLAHQQPQALTGDHVDGRALLALQGGRTVQALDRAQYTMHVSPKICVKPPPTWSTAQSRIVYFVRAPSERSQHVPKGAFQLSKLGLCYIFTLGGCPSASISLCKGCLIWSPHLLNTVSVLFSN